MAGERKLGVPSFGLLLGVPDIPGCSISSGANASSRRSQLPNHRRVSEDLCQTSCHDR
jgi:hypothetical protein